jgi:hypothetical protein
MRCLRGAGKRNPGFAAGQAGAACSDCVVIAVSLSIPLSVVPVTFGQHFSGGKQPKDLRMQTGQQLSGPTRDGQGRYRGWG